MSFVFLDIPLARDYATEQGLNRAWSDLYNPARTVDHIFEELEKTYQWHIEFDKTFSQDLAGLGKEINMILDWGASDVVSAVLCEQPGKNFNIMFSNLKKNIFDYYQYSMYTQFDTKILLL